MNRLRLKKNALNILKHPLYALHLCAEFPERIVRTTRGFTYHNFCCALNIARSATLLTFLVEQFLMIFQI